MRVRGGLALAVLALVGAAGSGCKDEDDACAPLAVAPTASAASPAAPCTKTEDCPRSCLCRDLGRCARGSDGGCVVGEDAHCRASRVCQLVGHCTASEGECVAATDADCRQSSVCESGGKCAVRDHRCVAGPAAAP